MCVSVPSLHRESTDSLIVQLPNEEGNMQHLVHHDMPCDSNLVSPAFYNRFMMSVFCLFGSHLQ